jgi:hypothetical protein
MSLQQKRKLQAMNDQKRAQSAIKSRRKQILNQLDYVDKGMEEGGHMEKLKKITNTISRTQETNKKNRRSSFRVASTTLTSQDSRIRSPAPINRREILFRSIDASNYSS